MSGQLAGLTRIADVLARMPYARFLQIEADEEDPHLCVMRFHDALIGNPVLPALHGGTLGALLETAALVTLIVESHTPTLPKIVDLNVEYLRSGRPRDTWAKAVITKHGRRVAYVRVEAWQDDPNRPIAAAHGHFLVQPPPE